MTTQNDERISIQFNGAPLIITKHAIERFVARHEGAIGPIRETKVLPKMEWLLKQAKPDRLPASWTAMRIINNGFQVAEYYKADGWRFVVLTEDGVSTLVTVERRK